MGNREPTIAHRLLSSTYRLVMETLWLGYDGLSVPYGQVVAVLIYQHAFDGLLARSYGHVPLGGQAVVLTSSGDYLPARWPPQHLRQRWATWRLWAIGHKS